MDSLFADPTNPTTSELLALRDLKGPDGTYVYDGTYTEQRLLGPDYVPQALGKRMGHSRVLQIVANRAREAYAIKPSNPVALAELNTIYGGNDESWRYSLRAREGDIDSAIIKEVNKLNGMKKYGVEAVTWDVPAPGGGTRTAINPRGTIGAMRAKGADVEALREFNRAFRTHRTLNKGGKIHDDIIRANQQSYSSIQAPNDGC